MPPEPAHAASRSRRISLRGALIALIGVLYVLAVPWYRDGDASLRLWFGLPDWVAVALLCYGIAAVLNAWAWGLTDVDDEADVDGPGGGGEEAP